eukprot:CAMPEP_0167827756 /NCGR_PEP_ID=MMETSP0112_2-20121227/10913_1 /TAXON_ID=91324 /ORGANISM="Lotharella globosa, Strain CCCM811" /LENGTH=181 /DNA_ID=CAMNT_0007730639 /DNA_START=1 /DNA_END=542 /DNA_ORIENTATION=+
MPRKPPPPPLAHVLANHRKSSSVFMLVMLFFLATVIISTSWHASKLASGVVVTKKSGNKISRMMMTGLCCMGFAGLNDANPNEDSEGSIAQFFRTMAALDGNVTMLHSMLERINHNKDGATAIKQLKNALEDNGLVGLRDLLISDEKVRKIFIRAYHQERYTPKPQPKKPSSSSSSSSSSS